MTRQPLSDAPSSPRRGYVLERSQWLPGRRDEVFPFFANARNLEAITPEFLQFRILTPEPIKMQSGTLLDYRLKLFGVPFHWQTLIERFEPPYRFVDTQRTGPYRRWHHTHEFHEVDGGTLMIDRVVYELPLGPLGSLAHALWVRATLERIFDFRNERIAELLGAAASLAVDPRESLAAPGTVASR